MFRATNSRGLSSLSNGISSASDLPPLNASSGMVYQPPNSTGSRNALIEIQRMRTSVMSQIQAVQSDQDRQIQQSEARMNMVLREISPKIQNLDRHNSFNQQQLDDLVERLSQLDSVIVPAIQQKSDEVQLKFEQSIRTETQTKLKPISDDIKQEQSKSDRLSDSATASVTNTNDKLKELSLLYDDFEKRASETHSYVQNHIININPRISKIEARLATYETAAESSVKNEKSQSNFKSSAKKIQQDLEDLEIDGIPLAIKSAESETLALVTSVSSQIEQKFTSSKLAISNMENSIKMTNERQKNVDSQVESLSKSSLDIQTSIGQKEQEINDKLTELETSIKSINEEIGGKLNELQDNNSGDSNFTLDALNDDIRSLKSTTKQYLMKLNQDWSQFHKENEKAQEITDSEIENLSSLLNGEFSLLEQINAAEKRTKWCLDRLQVWKKEVDDAEKLNVDDEKLIQRLEALEANLKEAEGRLAAIDNESAPESEEIEKEKYINENGEAPIFDSYGEDKEPLSIPSDMKLTYDENDEEIVIPDLPSREERKRNAQMKQPDVNPSNNEEGVEKDENKGDEDKKDDNKEDNDKKDESEEDSDDDDDEDEKDENKDDDDKKDDNKGDDDDDDNDSDDKVKKDENKGDDDKKDKKDESEEDSDDDDDDDENKGDSDDDEDDKKDESKEDSDDEEDEDDD